jgi:5-methylcytosine-specific restriction endonuclease McrA
LAWERDSYTCQECNKQRKGWKPDVHHIIPYRISNTHNLTNLLCLCRSCHTKAELKIGI